MVGNDQDKVLQNKTSWWSAPVWWEVCGILWFPSSPELLILHIFTIFLNASPWCCVGHSECHCPGPWLLAAPQSGAVWEMVAAHPGPAGSGTGQRICGADIHTHIRQSSLKWHTRETRTELESEGERDRMLNKGSNRWVQMGDEGWPGRLGAA